VHAEANAIIQAAKFGPSIDGGTIYTTSFPCNECAKLIINAGIIEVVAYEDYANPEAKEYLELAGILVRFIT
jgi:dCMP deaminase